MPFTAKSGKFNASINVVEFGTGDKAVKIGGENVFPLYSFDAAIENAPKVGIEITDFGMEHEPECIKKYYEGCATLADMARKAASMEGVDFLSFRMEGGDPNGANKSTEELIGELKEIADAVDLPLVVCGCKNVEKDAELFSKAAEALNGKNAVILSAKEENYKTVGAAAGLAYKQIVGAESAVDINLAKQLNVLISQLGVDSKSVVMNVGSAAVGYGFEYVISTMDRVKAAALQQGDANLQMPIITPVASETWGVKESVATEEDMPEDAQAFSVKEVPYVEVEVLTDFDQVMRNVLSGTSCLFIEGYEGCLCIDCRTYPARSVDEPDKDKSLRGSRDGFVETIVFNTALMRRRIRDPHLVMEMTEAGQASRTDIAVCYMSDRVDRELLKNLKNRIESLQVGDLRMNQQSLAEALFKRNGSTLFLNLNIRNGRIRQRRVCWKER